jgi:hypothetical protein
MQTTDNGGPSRLERAKAQAKKLVDSMRPGDRYKLIADGGGLDRVGYDFISSKSELNRLIDAIKPSDTTSDLSESLILAAESLRAIGGQSTAKSAAGASIDQPSKTDAVIAGKVWLFSDGVGISIPDVMGKSADLLEFVKIGESDHSVGVTQLAITPVPKEPRTYQVFVGLKNAWNVEKRVGVLLGYGDENNILPGQAQAITLAPGGQGGMVFEKVVSDPGKLFVHVDPANDDFLLDNTAYGIIEPPRKPKVVLVTRGDKVLEGFIKAAVRVGVIEAEIIVPEAFFPVGPNATQADLVIFDGVVPSQMPKIDTLLIRPQIKGAGDVGGFKITNEITDPAVLRWKREDPLMQYVELGELRLSKALMVERDPELIELVSGPESPLIAYRDFGGVRRYLIAFSPLVESNWWQQTSMVIFLKNIVEQTRLRHYIGMPQLLTTGSPAKLWDVADDPGTGEGRVTITSPDGSAQSVPVKQNAAEFEHTDEAGFYQVAAGAKKSLFAANLLNSTASDITPRSLQTAAGSNVQEAESVTSVNREIWQWLALAALAVLTLEWWVYHHRIA